MTDHPGINKAAVAHTAIMLNPHLSEAEKTSVLRKLSSPPMPGRTATATAPAPAAYHKSPESIAADIARQMQDSRLPMETRRAILNSFRLSQGREPLPPIPDDLMELIDPTTAEETVKMLALFTNLKGQARRLEIRRQKSLQHKRRREVDVLTRQEADISKRRERLRVMREELTSWTDRAMSLERPDGHLLPRLIEEVKSGEAIIAASSDYKDYIASFIDLWAEAQSFLVEHDWAAAFANAADHIDGEIKLPYDVCVFEFRISGKPVIATAFKVDGRLVMMHAIRTKAGWIQNGSIFQGEDGKFYGWRAAEGEGPITMDPSSGELLKIDPEEQGLLLLVVRQIKAISIMLDAEVAKTEIIRTPYRSNQPRDHKGQTGYSYHVISLSHRSRAANRAPADPAPPPHAKKRLHFRRGHDRHYANHKVWIHWQLVGDPELGWIEKHYKL